MTSAEKRIDVTHGKVLGQIVDTRKQHLPDEPRGTVDVVNPLKADKLPRTSGISLSDDSNTRPLESGRDDAHLEPLAKHRGKAVNGNRHDLPPLPVRLLHTGYGSVPGVHGSLAQYLNLDGGADTRAKGTRKRTNGLYRATPPADDAAGILLGAADLDESGAIAVRHVKGDGILVGHKTTYDVLDKIGDLVGGHLLDSGVRLVEGIHGIRDFLGHDTYSASAVSASASAAAASAAASASAAALAAAFLESFCFFSGAGASERAMSIR